MGGPERFVNAVARAQAVTRTRDNGVLLSTNAIINGPEVRNVLNASAEKKIVLGQVAMERKRKNQNKLRLVRNELRLLRSALWTFQAFGNSVQFFVVIGSAS